MKKALFTVLLASFILLLTACSKETEVSKYVERVPGEAYEFKEKDYVKVSESENAELYLNPSKACFKWVDKSTGLFKETRVFDKDVSDAMLKDDLIVYYFTGGASERYASYSSMDSQAYSVDMETVSYEKIDKGVRVIYFLSNSKVGFKDFPAYISDERLNNLVIQYLDAKQLKTLKKQYRQLKSGDWSRSSNDANPLNGLSAKALYEIFYEVGHYTYEELEYDDTLYDKMDEFPQRQQIEVTMDYFLDGDDMMVNIDTANIVTNSDYPIKSLSVLPYFLSSKADDGYLFIPDGSGALLYFDNKKIKEYQFTSRFWNCDILQNVTGYSTTNAEMTMPVYGIKDDDMAILGIIEEGAETATLSAYVKNSYNSVPYNRVSLSFAIHEDQQLASFSNAITNFTLKKCSTDYYAGNIRIRYKFLTGDNANYSGMARSYRSYLLERGDLKVNEPEEKAPVFVEIPGYIDATKYFLGIPYKGKTVITSYSDTKQILEDMTSRGIENIKLDYKGVANGGLLQRTAEKVKLSSELGGEKAFNELKNYTLANGIELFPDFQLQTVNTGKGLAKKNRAFFINGEVAQIYDFTLISHTANKDDDYPTYIVSPLYLSEYINRFRESYKKLGITNLASEDFFKFVAPTYKKNENTSITKAMETYKEALDKLSGDYKLLLSNPVSKAWSNVNYISDIPFDGIDLKVMDAYIPFEQIVLSGSITYSSEILNSESYDMKEDLMKTMEYGSAPKFRFITTDTSELIGTKAEDIFLAEYENLDSIVAELYKEYAGFYGHVRGASLESHEYLNREGTLSRTQWSNGVTVYFNYDPEEAEADGLKIPAGSYIIVDRR